jgi:PAS domain S-box-containing protein
MREFKNEQEELPRVNPLASIIKYSPKIIGEILDIVHNAVFLLDGENRIFIANSQMETMFKANDKQLADLEFADLFMPEDRMIFVPNIVKITKEKGEFECETMLRCMDGTLFFGLVSCVAFLWDGKDFIATTIHDITKMKSIERMLKHSEHEAFLGHMLNDISHHIRNPVLVIAGLAKRLKKNEPDAKYADIINKESQRLESLLDTLNSFILLPRPQLRPTSLAELIERVDQQIKPFVIEFGIKWNWAYPENLLLHNILADISLLLDAIKAVTRNACESYTRDEKNKIVSAQLLETFEPSWPYALKIIDKGCGIAKDDLPFVTSHFFTKKSRHMGMGLTFAQRILEEQDGELIIESSEDQGTTVTLFFKKERRKSIRRNKL